MPEQTGSRRSARAILRDEKGRVLLLRFVMQRGGAPFAFWATPGGSVEAGENDLSAVRRELLEEVGLDVPLMGPVHALTDRFEHEGHVVETTDIFFLGHCHKDAPSLRGHTNAERNAITTMRWWTLTEVEEGVEFIFPADLAQILRRN